MAGVNGCSPGFVDINGECFSFRPEVSLDWEDSQVYCTNTSYSIGLAEVKNANTHREVYEYIKTYGLTGSFWLGASDLEYDGDWVWLDGTRVERGTPFWSLHYGVLGTYLRLNSWSQEPTGGAEENCLALDSGRFFYFNDVACDKMNHPICQEA
ncbi:collectin-12-like 2 [Homarus americanus]|uniref:Collectin-12-like 2 n=1 Tax=Homarus americanus TaxID=6706 RepID=A0A8J5JM51_HOMAM|nr:collectin-12-like 2 [Homarus americanus]